MGAGGAGAGEGEASQADSWPQRVAMELRYPLRVFAARAQHPHSVPSPAPGSPSSGRPGAALEAWRQALGAAGMTWLLRPLALPLPTDWHIEKFVDDDAALSFVHHDARPPLGGRGGGTGTEAAGCGQGGAEGCPGKTMWMRSMAVPGSSDSGCLGGARGSSLGAVGGEGYDVGAAFGLVGIPPLHLGCGDLRRVRLPGL